MSPPPVYKHIMYLALNTGSFSLLSLTLVSPQWFCQPPLATISLPCQRGLPNMSHWCPGLAFSFLHFSPPHQPHRVPFSHYAPPHPHLPCKVPLNLSYHRLFIFLSKSWDGRHISREGEGLKRHQSPCYKCKSPVDLPPVVQVPPMSEVTEGLSGRQAKHLKVTKVCILF